MCSIKFNRYIDKVGDTDVAMTWNIKCALFKSNAFKECTLDYTEMRQLCWTGTVTCPYNSWSRGDRGMKIWSKVALDATLADTKFQGSGYTGSRVVPIIRLIFDQFFQSSECSKS